MATTNPYPVTLKDRIHQLYYIEQKPMLEAVAILKTEFPEVANRITTDRMHSTARVVRLKLGLPPKHPEMSTAGPRKPKVRTQNKKLISANRKEVIEAARKLRQRNYRWQAVRDELIVQFPGEKIPTAAALSNIAKGNKPQNGNGQYQITISSSSGAVINATISSKKSFEKIIRDLLEA